MFLHFGQASVRGFGVFLETHLIMRGTQPDCGFASQSRIATVAITFVFETTPRARTALNCG